MGRADLPLGMRLRQQAGWNQTEADWLRHLDLEADACFVAEWDGVPCGTTCTATFGPVAWVAMVLVDVDMRRRGIGQALLEHALAHLDRRGAASIRLDATPLGRPLYEKLGFVAQFELARWEGLLPPSPPVAGAAPVAGVTPVAAQELAQVFALDRQVSATDRRSLLERLYAEQAASFRAVKQGGQLRGFAAARAGANATQLGPCMADSQAGPLLLADAFHRCAGRRVYLDVPLANAAAMKIAESQGLTVQRNFVRMCRGKLVEENVSRLWGSFGPEKG